MKVRRYRRLLLWSVSIAGLLAIYALVGNLTRQPPPHPEPGTPGDRRKSPPSETAVDTALLGTWVRESRQDGAEHVALTIKEQTVTFYVRSRTELGEPIHIGSEYLWPQRTMRYDHQPGIISFFFRDDPDDSGYTVSTPYTLSKGSNVLYVNGGNIYIHGGTYKLVTRREVKVPSGK